MRTRNFYRLALFAMTSLLVVGAIVDGRWLLLGLFLAYGSAVHRSALGINTKDDE